MHFWQPIRILAILIFSLGMAGCAPSGDSATQLNRQQILDAVDSALTVQDCATAIDTIKPLYNSAATDNDVRMKMASAYACDAHINFFKLMGDLASNANAMATGSGLWTSMAKLFPSTAGSDYVVEGGLLGMDAVFSALNTGAVVLPNDQVNAGTFNVGSIFTEDRISDANIYLTFLAMASMGGLENRYGSPDPSTFIKTTPFPWSSPLQMTATSDGCAIASSMFNIIDGMSASTDAMGGAVGKSFGTATALLNIAFDAACQAGCQGTAAAVVNALPQFVKDPVGNPWVTTGPNCAGTCTACPKALRDRRKCTGTNDDISCAALGLIQFLNVGLYGWN